MEDKENKYFTKELIEILNQQKQRKEKGGLYHKCQVDFAYNSNKIEGSRLTEEQTEQIFDSNTIFINKDEELVRLDDLIETLNHFRLFDKMLDTLDQPLSEQLLIDMNVILKRGTSYEDDIRYNVGGYKTQPNVVGVINVFHTTPPELVPKEMNKLLSDYLSKNSVNVEDIVDFHVRFERIHPFGDGNGRIGRMVMFRECLKNDIVPFIVRDVNRPFYIRGLQKYKEERGFLVDTCLTEQDYFKKVCEYFRVPLNKEQEVQYKLNIKNILDKAKERGKTQDTNKTKRIKKKNIDISQ